LKLPSRPPQSVTWNPGDYAANSAAQLAWAKELIEKLKLRGDERILDVGCGDGKVTAQLAHAVPKGAVIGIDASAEMIQFAQKTFPPSKISNLKFEIRDARHIRFEQRFDLIFSNAALHWVDDHQAFLHGVAACLKPGGRLVVSCGGKGNAHDVFIVLRAVIRLKRWREFFRKLERPYFFHSPEEYEKWLPHFGFKSCRVKLAPKNATYDGRDGFAAWLRTTWLPYVQRVPEKQREEFITVVTERYISKHPLDADGKVHVNMVRLEIDAVKI